MKDFAPFGRKSIKVAFIKENSHKITVQKLNFFAFRFNINIVLYGNKYLKGRK